MTLTSEAQKKANQKWREANKERYNAICLASTKIYNENNKDKIKLKQNGYYLYRKETERLRNIYI
jgi:hypothetical protein